MKITKEKIDAINETYKNDLAGTRGHDIGMNISSSIGGTSIYHNNWEVCKLEELDDMIRELERMRACIQFETGVIF